MKQRHLIKQYREQFQKNADLQKAIKDKKPGSGATPPKN